MTDFKNLSKEAANKAKAEEKKKKRLKSRQLQLTNMTKGRKKIS